MKRAEQAMRLNMLRTWREKDLSPFIFEVICSITGNIREERGDMEAERIAKQITVILSLDIPEEDMVKRINQLST